MAADTGAPRPELLGMMIDYAHGRIAYARHANESADRTGVLHALHQLKGICVHAGDPTLTSAIHDLEARAAAAVGTADLDRVLAEGLPPVEAALDQLDPVRALPRTQTVGDALAPVLSDAARTARRRGVELTVDPPTGAEIVLPARSVMMLVDALGHLLRNAVVHGAGAGVVRVRISARIAEDGGFLCTVANIGPLRTDPAPADVDSGRGVALAAIAAELGRIGGRLRHGPTEHGYAATIALPAAWVEPADGRRRSPRR